MFKIQYVKVRDNRRMLTTNTPRKRRLWAADLWSARPVSHSISQRYSVTSPGYGHTNALSTRGFMMWFHASGTLWWNGRPTFCEAKTRRPPAWDSTGLFVVCSLHIRPVSVQKQQIGKTRRADLFWKSLTIKTVTAKENYCFNVCF